MSLLWNIVSWFLYAEVAFILLLFSPIDPRIWQKRVFNLRILNFIKSHTGPYFTMIFVGLSGLFAESIREIYKYRTALDTNKPHVHQHTHTNELVKEFRAQRNFYITGFALFLWLVIRQIIQNISNQAELLSIKDLKDNQIKELNNSLTVATNEIEILRSEIKSKTEKVEKVEKERKTSIKASDSEFVEDIADNSEEDL